MVGDGGGGGAAIMERQKKKKYPTKGEGRKCPEFRPEGYLQRDGIPAGTSHESVDASREVSGVAPLGRRRRKPLAGSGRSGGGGEGAGGGSRGGRDGAHPRRQREGNEP